MAWGWLNWCFSGGGGEGGREEAKKSELGGYKSHKWISWYYVYEVNRPAAQVFFCIMFWHFAFRLGIAARIKNRLP